jgi:putative transposase
VYILPPVPWGLKRFQETRNLHFITFSCYHRAPLLATPQARRIFEQTLERVRQWYGLYVTGYVVMPEHVHLLISEPERGKLSLAIQMLKQNVAQELGKPGGGSFWQARYYDFNVWSERKQIEKLRYLHRNPVKRGLVDSPEDWAWSSFRHYLSGLEGVVEIESQWTAHKREQMGLRIQITSHHENPRPVSPKNGETRTGHPRGSLC